MFAVGPAQQGISVALSADGNTAVVGGRSDDNWVGAAWVFTRSGDVWSQQGPKLVGTGAVGNAEQGVSVAISADGNTAIVGGRVDNAIAGAAWVYTRTGGVWSQQGPKLVGSDAVGAAMQGISVGLSADGNTAVMGGPNDNSLAGAAWVYTRSGGVWSQQGAKLVGTGAVGNGRQGAGVALSADGNTVVVGGFGDNSNVGSAWVFTRSGGVWSQQGAKLVGTGTVGASTFGHSVSVSADGNTALIGALNDSLFTGAAWVFTRSSGVWSQLGAKLVGHDAVGRGYQGVSVSVSADGNTAVVGGGGDNSDVGAAWVFAASASSQPPVVYRGLEHTALGGAVITRNGGNQGTLSITNIGSSGLDGVSIDFGAMSSAGGDVGVVVSFDVATSVGVDGAELVATFRGSIDGGNEQDFGTVTHVDPGTGTRSLSVDFSLIGVPSYRVEVFSGETLVYEADSHPGTNISYGLLSPVMRPSTGERVAAGDPIPGLEIILDKTPPHPPKLKEKLRLFDLSNIDLGDGTGPHVGDLLVFTGRGSAVMSAAVLARATVTASNFSELVLSDVALIAFAVKNRVLGDATFLGCATCAMGGAPGLVVSNMGSSGNDGLSVDLGRVQSFEVSWDPLDSSGSAPVGAYIEATAMGSIGGVTDQPLGNLRVTKGASAYDITADFSAIGSPTVRVQVLDGGVLVADFLGHTGAVGTSATWPMRIDKLGGTTECYATRYPPGTVFQIDGAPHTGDELRMLAEATSAPIDYKSGLSLRASRLSTMTITSETSYGSVLSSLPFASSRVSFALFGFRPNPARGQPVVWFSLPSAEPARLELIDLGGRLLWSREVGSLAAGHHGLAVDGAPLSPGVYWLRLTRAGQALTTRAVVLN